MELRHVRYPDRLEIHLVWREKDPAPAVSAFVATSAGVSADQALPDEAAAVPGAPAP